MDESKKFSCNDRQLGTYLNSHGSKLICIENGVYIFEYDDSIEDNLRSFERLQEKCMF